MWKFLVLGLLVNVLVVSPAHVKKKKSSKTSTTVIDNTGDLTSNYTTTKTIAINCNDHDDDIDDECDIIDISKTTETTTNSVLYCEDDDGVDECSYTTTNTNNETTLGSSRSSTTTQKPYITTSRMVKVCKDIDNDNDDDDCMYLTTAVTDKSGTSDSTTTYKLLNKTATSYTSIGCTDDENDYYNECELEKNKLEVTSTESSEDSTTDMITDYDYDINKIYQNCNTTTEEFQETTKSTSDKGDNTTKEILKTTTTPKEVTTASTTTKQAGNTTSKETTTTEVVTTTEQKITTTDKEEVSTITELTTLDKVITTTIKMSTTTEKNIPTTTDIIPTLTEKVTTTTEKVITTTGAPTECPKATAELTGAMVEYSAKLLWVKVKSSPPKTEIVSALPIVRMAGMLKTKAFGRTDKQLSSFLNLKKNSLVLCALGKINKHKTASPWSNARFLDENIIVGDTQYALTNSTKREWVDVVGGDTVNVDFTKKTNAINIINAKVENGTNGLVTDVITLPDLENKTVQLAFVSGLAYSPRFYYKPKSIEMKNFSVTPCKTVQLPYYGIKEHLNYTESALLRSLIVEVPLADAKKLILIQSKEKFHHFSVIRKLQNPDVLYSALDRLKPKLLQIYLPIIKAVTSNDYVDYFKKMNHVNRILKSDTAEFKDLIVHDKHVSVNVAKGKILFESKFKGVRPPSNIRKEPYKEIYFDFPFVWYLMHDRIPLCMGLYADDSSAK